MEGLPKHEVLDTPQVEQNSLPIEKFEKSSFSYGFLLTLKNQLLDSLEPVLMVVDNARKEVSIDYETRKEKEKALKELSNEAGKFFESLIPAGLKRTEITRGVVRSGSDSKITDKDDYLSMGYPYLISKRRHRLNKEESFKEGIFRDERTPFDGTLTEKKLNDEAGGEITRQEVTRALAQAGGENLIYEMIVNDLNSDKNQASSSLIIQNIKDGTSLDLNALLPYQYKFVPSFMDRENTYVDTTSEDREDWGVRHKWDSVANLKDYLKEVPNEGRFVVRVGYKRVEYGDLTKKGAFTSLFHEITHSWQGAYHKQDIEKGNSGFEKFFPKVQDLFYKTIQAYIEANGATSDKSYQKVLQDTKSEFKTLGVEFCKDTDGSDIIVSVTQQKGEDIINIQTPWNELLKEDPTLGQRYFPIKSARLKKVMDSYIAEERDAWAHALRTIRFLRSKGFDVEPELKTLADIKAIIDPCLESYQSSTENLVAMGKGDYRFARLD